MARIYHGFAPPKPTENKQAEGPKEAKQPSATKAKNTKTKGANEGSSE